MKHCKRSALRYLGLGWNALALCDPDHRGVDREHTLVCDSPGKSPVSGKWKHWQRSRVTEEEIHLQWRVWPRANVGVILGLASGLVGVDVDGEGGLDVLKQISCGELPRTATFTTGKGLRLLYRLPAGVFVPSAVYPGGLEILAEGRQTVMPPSVHVCGAAYRWARGKGPAALSNAPDWLWRSRGRGQVLPGAGVMAGEGPILEGNPGRNSTLFRVAAAMARAGAAAGDMRAAMREMNRRCQPALSEAELNSIVRSACRYRPCQERP